MAQNSRSYKKKGYSRKCLSHPVPQGTELPSLCSLLLMFAGGEHSKAKQRAQRHLRVPLLSNKGRWRGLSLTLLKFLKMWGDPKIFPWFRLKPLCESPSVPRSLHSQTSEKTGQWLERIVPTGNKYTGVLGHMLGSCDLVCWKPTWELVLNKSVPSREQDPGTGWPH